MKSPRESAVAVLAGIAFAHASQTLADTPLERGTYLMHSIVVCGNCHSPQGRKGPIAGMALAGGLVIED